MNLTRQSVLTASALLIGGFIGASALVALAQQTSTWSAPLHSPSTCLSGEPGCDAPINVGGAGQSKTGLLSLGNFQFVPPGMPAGIKGSVLSATDQFGTVGWVATSSLGLSGGVSSGVTSIVAGSNVTISPTGGTGNVTINAVAATPNYNLVQARLKSGCSTGQSLTNIDSSGNGTCSAITDGYCYYGGGSTNRYSPGATCGVSWFGNSGTATTCTGNYTWTNNFTITTVYPTCH